MKYKKQSIFVVASFMALATLAGITALNNFGFNLAPRGSGEEPSFTINGNTAFTELSGGGYSGIATDEHSSNSITLNFIGFNYDDQADNLYIAKGHNAYFTNTTPIRGIDETLMNFVSRCSENIKFAAITFYSYNPLTFENIQAGKYIDLFVI